MLSGGCREIRLVPARGAASGDATLVAAWYVGLSAFALAAAYRSRGLGRGSGAVIVCAYLAFSVMLVAIAYS